MPTPTTTSRPAMPMLKARMAKCDHGRRDDLIDFSA
jgi:hypothetical protein